MCGIFGCLGAEQDEQALRLALAHALEGIVHRGPDDVGIHADGAVGLGLGHRRLSIVDLSAAGHQPMSSAAGRYVIVFNGEIYNHLALRAELQKALGSISWRGHSDTETLLAGIERWGLEATLGRCIGMFAIALWDRRERVLSLARDRIGEKPLYVGHVGRTVLFSSDLAALHRWPGFTPRVDRQALAAYMQRGWIPGPRSIFEGIQKVPPGHLLQITPEQARAGGALPTSRAYWSLLGAAEAGARKRVTASFQESADRLETLLQEAVGRQMIADVPLGAFLSGGIDSSTIVALMQAQSSRRVRTYSIGFHERAYNEAEDAKRVAAHLGTEHTELYVGVRDALAVIPRLSETFSEPFADASQIPMLMLCELTRQHVTVALSGDAGDELFGGYNRHVTGGAVWRHTRVIPPMLRQLVGRGIEGVSPANWDRTYKVLSPLLPRRLKTRLPGDKLHKLARVLGARTGLDFYLGLAEPWLQQDATIQRSSDFSLPDLGYLNELDIAEQMMAMDSVSYLPDDVLVKVDRSSMAASLEARAPFLDHTIVEYAWTLPLDYKIQGGQGKRILRDVLGRYVPLEFIDRPKMGFAIPIDQWLRTSLRDWAEHLLAPERLARGGLLQVAPVRQKWKEHLSGARNWQTPLWNILMFQAWHEHWGIRE